MTLLALLVSSDDSASEILGRVLPTFGLAVERHSDFSAAFDHLRQQKFDALVIDYEDATAAAELEEEARRLNSGRPLVTVALVSEAAHTRDILGAGAHFMLYKPLTEDKARAGLRAVAASLKRERRRTQRVPVQVAVELSLPDTRKSEGILLNVSEDGMDVLTAEQQVPEGLLNIRFRLPDAKFEVNTCGQVAWANLNGETGVRFVELDRATKSLLQNWLLLAAGKPGAGSEETVDECKLTDLSLGGCYVETVSPFPEHSLVELCLKTEAMAVHTEGVVRVMHPEHGMGIEFPSRTQGQREQVGNLIQLLQSSPESAPQLSVAPRALRADMSQFEPAPKPVNESPEESAAVEMAVEMEDPLLDLLRQGSGLQQEDFLERLRGQRSPESVAT